MTDLPAIPALPHRPGLPPDVDDVMGLSDAQADELWGQIIAVGPVIREKVGLLLYRELAVRGERALARRVAVATEALGVTASTLASWRRAVEEQHGLRPPSPRATAGRQAALTTPSESEGVGDADLSAPSERLTPDAIIQPEPPEADPERPRPVHVVDRRATAAITVEMTEDEVTVLDAWAAFLGVRADEVLLRMLRRTRPPETTTPEAATLRRAFKKLTGDVVA